MKKKKSTPTKINLPPTTESELISLSGARILIKSIKGEYSNPYADDMLESIKKFYSKKRTKK